MEPFILSASEKVPYFTLSHWENEFPHLIVGCSCKHKNVDWNNSNYALHVGNNKCQVIRNRQKLVEQLSMPLSSWTSGEQVHDTQVAIVTQREKGKGSASQDTALNGTDGLLTREENILLTTYYADCVPLYFYSPDIDIIGSVHSGWRGTVKNIAGKVVEILKIQGAKTENIRAAIGPSIGPCCYEVDEKVISLLQTVILCESALGTVLEEKNQSRWKLDLKRANKILLEKAGVLPEHISTSFWCTSCTSKYFHSHRRDAGDTGRMVAWIGKRKGSNAWM